MTPGSLIAVSAGVYAFVAMHFGWLWWIRRQNQEHGAFALLAGTLCLFALSAARVAEARTVAEAARAQEIQYFFAEFAAGAFVVFCSRLSGTPGRRLERISWTVAIVSASACAAGLFVDPDVPTPAWDGRTPELGGQPGAALLPVGRVALVGACVFATFGLAHLGRAAVRDRHLRPMSAAAALFIAGGMWDITVRVGGFSLSYVASVVPVASVAAISWALLDRWARVESELEQRTKELIRNHDALCHAHQQLVRKEQLAAVGELSAIIAHELRNPLAILRHAVSGLRREDLRRDDAETLLRILDEEVDRLNRLVQDVMTYARPVTPEPTPVRVQELVARAVELARESHPQHKAIAFAFRSEGADDIVEGDPALLRHALINIVDNAIQAMPDGGTVTITVRSTQLDGREALAIDFQDEGEGMDTLVRSKARDPFFTTRASGTGLGLAIVDRVARMHGGRVEIESQYGQGTTVTLILPRRRVSSPPPATFG